MLWRAPEAELFGLCAAAGISQIVWSPLAQGVLTGKYRLGPAPPPDSRAANPDMNVAMDRLLDDAVLEAVDRLRPIAEEAASRWPSWRWPGCCAAPSSRRRSSAPPRPEQVHAYARASGIQLTPDTLAAIEEALGDTPVKADPRPLAQPGVTHRRLQERPCDYRSPNRQWASMRSDLATSPVYMRDPDGHLLEIGQTTSALRGR